MLIATCMIWAALQAGLDADRLRVIGGAQCERLLAGKDPLDLGPRRPVGNSKSTSILLERINAMLLLAVSRILMGDSGHEPLALARLACDVGTDQGPEAAVCRNLLALLELDARQTEDHSGTGFAARGASIVMLAANMTRTPDVPLPEISELATATAMRNASMVGHRLLDAAEPVAQSEQLRRVSAIFPTIDVTRRRDPTDRQANHPRQTATTSTLNSAADAATLPYSGHQRPTRSARNRACSSLTELNSNRISTRLNTVRSARTGLP
jgi:hypothetical protein